ncbi:hypothetical protein [Mucilaginibacter pedocola]|uniref:Uncharacterized protein n=1 Tax=Mucilaginibacter pedocola TaxID=1792845 RepID=A0A1S9PAN6_9SPHI|nr:hypothetical protein [Mucilaginibacter pedocola]OOQ58043.1 hypothetical protein BC343_10295 [Mucilaginibacter pedocola]
MTQRTFTKILAIVLIAGGFTACSKKMKTTGCPTGQICTMEFAALTVSFVDKAGAPVNVKDVKVVNLRTNTAVLANGMGSKTSQDGKYVFVTDGNKKQLSTEGDDIKITATNAATNKMVSAIIKVSGGCNCHVAKVSGEDTIVFE